MVPVWLWLSLSLSLLAETATEWWSAEPVSRKEVPLRDLQGVDGRAVCRQPRQDSCRWRRSH